MMGSTNSNRTGATKQLTTKKPAGVGKTSLNPLASAARAVDICSRYSLQDCIHCDYTPISPLIPLIVPEHIPRSSRSVRSKLTNGLNLLGNPPEKAYPESRVIMFLSLVARSSNRTYNLYLYSLFRTQIQSLYCTVK